MKINRFYLFFALTVILFTNGCSTTYTSVKGKIFSPQEVSSIIEELRIQEDKVNSFYSTGSVTVKDWKSELDAISLIVGEKEPFRLKIEITHSWGRPVLHILIDKEIIEILSFEEEKFYRGRNKPGVLSEFLSDIDPQLIWTVSRGYPPILEHQRVISPGRNRISLLDKLEKGVETIYFDPETLRPSLVSFPSFNMEVKFLGLTEDKGIHYAQMVVVDSHTSKKTLVLKNSRIVFNKSIPDEIFSIKCPPMFKIVDLN